jgi:RNA polymerase sigma-70 factor, ECF subfamily
MSSTDIETLRAFYVGSRQLLYTYAVSITGNREAAEDAIHGVFEKLLRRGALPADLRPYVFRSVRNAAFDAWRRTKVRTDSIFAAATAVAAAEPGSPAVSRTDELESLLQQLSPDERETIVLKIYNGFTCQEIADLRQVPLPTVASWYRRGLEKLKALLAPESR